jgi:hypothetical protein
VVSPRVTKIAATGVCLWTLAKVSAFTTPRFDLVHLKFTLFIGTSFPCEQAFGAFSCRPLHHPGSAKSERKPRCNASGPICPICRRLSNANASRCKPTCSDWSDLWSSTPQVHLWYSERRPFWPEGALAILSG